MTHEQEITLHYKQSILTLPRWNQSKDNTVACLTTRWTLAVLKLFEHTILFASFQPFVTLLKAADQNLSVQLDLLKIRPAAHFRP